MRPEFGCGVHDFVFDSIDASTVGKMELAIRDALDRWEPRIVVGDRRLRPRRGRRRPADHRHRLPRPRHQHDAQPRLSVLRDSRGGVGVRLPEIQLDDRRFQDLVSEARLKISALVPGVDRAQRLRPRHHADRAVRVDDGDDDLPAQPRAGQAPRVAARAARHPPRRPQRRADQPALPAARAGGRAAGDRGRRTEVGTPRTATEESIVFQVDERLHDPGRGPGGLRAPARRPGQEHRPRRRRGQAGRRRPARVRAARPRSATRSTSASRSRSAAC